MAVSLRVPEQIRKRIAKLARRRRTTPHALMLEAITEKVQAEESRATFHAEASRRLKNMKKAGTGIPAEKVFAYLTSRATGNRNVRPRARKVV
jgi:predicted transcriptional regulator